MWLCGKLSGAWFHGPRRDACLGLDENLSGRIIAWSSRCYFAAANRFATSSQLMMLKNAAT
jgi:hypothetical protein